MKRFWTEKNIQVLAVAIVSMFSRPLLAREEIANTGAAAKAMVQSLQVNNEAMLRSTKKTDADDAKTRNYVVDKLKMLDRNENANWIFETSVKSLRIVFRDGELNSDDNLIRALKQTACIFVAETEYGNLSEQYDDCDQTNIGQIRPPAYKEIFKSCADNFTSKDLQFLGSGTTCETLHPYEMPLCCEAVKKGEKNYNCQKYKNDPLLCISKQKRDYLEKSDMMSATSLENDLSQGSDEESALCVDDFTNSGFDKTSTPGRLNFNIQTDPVTCVSTSGSKYVRIPAAPMHSVFSSIFYLKLIGYQPMADKDFAKFGAHRYNAADRAQQASYQKKLNTCLQVLNESDNTKIIVSAYKKLAADTSKIVKK